MAMPPKLGTLYKVPSELFSGLKAAFSHKALHTVQYNNEVLVECGKNGG